MEYSYRLNIENTKCYQQLPFSVLLNYHIKQIAKLFKREGVWLNLPEKKYLKFQYIIKHK